MAWQRMAEKGQIPSLLVLGLSSSPALGHLHSWFWAFGLKPGLILSAPWFSGWLRLNYTTSIPGAPLYLKLADGQSWDFSASITTWAYIHIHIYIFTYVSLYMYINFILSFLFLWRTPTNLQNNIIHTGWPYYFRPDEDLETRFYNSIWKSS